MLSGLIVLLACQLAGGVVVRILDLPVPGPVVGMLVFLVVLRVRRPRRQSGLVTAPAALLRYLPLLYVPAGVGVVAHLSQLRDDALPVAGGLVLSWLAGLLAAATATALALRASSARRRAG